MARVYTQGGAKPAENKRESGPKEKKAATPAAEGVKKGKEGAGE